MDVCWKAWLSLWRPDSNLSLREEVYHPVRVKEMEAIAARHGIHLAPLYKRRWTGGDGLHGHTEYGKSE